MASTRTEPVVDRIISRRAERYQLRCTSCDALHAPSVRTVRCANCSGTLAIARHSGVADDAADDAAIASLQLGQGATPVVELARMAAELGIARMSAKIEYLAPTASFKDRGSATVIAAAVEEGITEFVEDSSGNAGASMAAYAASAGIAAHIFVPESAAPGKLQQIRVYGAELHAVHGPRQAATEAAVAFAEAQQMPYLSHALSPWFVEGVKSFATEIVDAGLQPTDIVLPVGNGSLLLATDAVLIERDDAGGWHPRLHAVQANAVRPLADAMPRRVERQTEANAFATTVASGIAVQTPPRLAEMRDAVLRHGGSVVTVDDRATLDHQRLLGQLEGIFCEPTSATVFAAIAEMVRDGTLGHDARVLVPVTGSGLKEPLAQSQ